MAMGDQAPHLAVLWHSRTGAARALARAAAMGARRAGGRVQLVAAARARAETLQGALAYLFVAPENLGALSGAMKEMFDRLYYPLLGQIEGRAYATIIAAGNAGQGAEAQIERIVTGWRLRRVAEGMIWRSGITPEPGMLAASRVDADALARAGALGATLALGAEAGIF